MSDDYERCDYTGRPVWEDAAGNAVKEGNRVTVFGEDGAPDRLGTVVSLDADADSDYEGGMVDCSTIHVLCDGDHEDDSIAFARIGCDGFERIDL